MGTDSLHPDDTNHTSGDRPTAV